MRKALAALLVLAIASLAASAATVNVMHGWPGEQAPAFEKIVAAFEAENPDIDVVVEIVGRDRPTILATRIAGGNPPDLTPHPWIGLMKEWADAGEIVDLTGLVDTSDINPALVPIGEYDGGLYGLFIFPNVKSLIWYNPKQFTAKGYAVPNTWYELLALSEKMVADGAAPFSIGIESGAASGWPGTDWIEDIMLRTAGADVYDKWVNHEIPWTDPRVKLAFETFGSLFDKGYVLGGGIGALTTNFGDAADPLFTDPPTAYMHHQATFIQGFFNDHFDGLVAGEDYDVFPLPTITPKATADGSVPLLVSGDVVTVFDNRPEVIKFAQFLTSETAADIWSSELGELSAYVDADPAQFESPITAKAQEMLLSATVSRFDGSDLMPGAIGAGAFWSGVLDYLSGINLDTVLATIEAAAVEAY
jgi:alpha-glucoside transport system substrate-binding protein